MKFKKKIDVIKFLLKWKNDCKFNLKYLYNVKIIYSEDFYYVKIGEVLGIKADNGLKFYLDYIRDRQKEIIKA